MRRVHGSLSLLCFGAVVAGAGWIASRYSPRDPKTELWYRNLKKPPYHPPDAVFPIVWTALYALIAVSGWRVWRSDEHPERRSALGLWALQLILNIGWTRLFFGDHLPAWSLADIVCLQSTVIAYIIQARKADKLASDLFVPYAAWLAFAALLNEEIVRRNRQADL